MKRYEIDRLVDARDIAGVRAWAEQLAAACDVAAVAAPFAALARPEPEGAMSADTFDMPAPVAPLERLTTLMPLGPPAPPAAEFTAREPQTAT